MFKIKCLKCDKTNIKAKRESFAHGLWRIFWNIIFPIRILMSAGKKPKTLFVCRDCGFSWEDR